MREMDSDSSPFHERVLALAAMTDSDLRRAAAVPWPSSPAERHIGCFSGPLPYDPITYLALEARLGSLFKGGEAKSPSTTNRGLLLLRARRYEGAVAAFSAAEEGAAAPKARLGKIAALGALVLHRPNFVEPDYTPAAVIKCFDLMPSDGLDYWFARFYAAMAEANLRGFRDAAVSQLLEIATELKLPMPWLMRAQLATEVGRYDEAIASALIAGQLDPNSSSPPTVMALAEIGAGRLQRGMILFADVVQRFGPTPAILRSVWRVLAEPHLAASDLPSVDAVLQEIDNRLASEVIDADNFSIDLMRGLLAVHRGRFDEARTRLRQAATVSPALSATLQEADIRHAEQPFQTRGDDIFHVFVDPRSIYTSYNVLEHLVCGEIARRRSGRSLLKVVFVGYSPEPGHERQDAANFLNAGMARAELEWRLRNMLVPFCSLLPSCAGITVCASREEAASIREQAGDACYPHNYHPAFPRYMQWYNTRLIQDELATRGGLPSLEPPARALEFMDSWMASNLRGREAVVLTLRNTQIDAVRNSRADDWARFADWLPSRFVPVVVPDTYSLFESSAADFPKGVVVCESAALLVELRAALYRRAYVTMSIANGPVAIASFDRWARYLMFGVATVGQANTLPLLRNVYGATPGDHFMNAQPFQRLVWDIDSFDVLRNTFERMVQDIDRTTTEA
jgi:tetratricopeptide (TPR) repeat protein